MRPAASSRSTASSRPVSPYGAGAAAGGGVWGAAAAGGCSGIRARSARARTWASSGACPSAAAAAARSAAAAAVAGCPASRCAWAWRHQAYPARCGQPRSCQASAAARQAPGSLAPASRACSASQVARSAGMVATNGWSVNGAPGAWSDPGGQAVGGGLGGSGGGFVAACPGLFGQVGAGPHARRQQPPAEDGQVRGLEQREHPLDLGQGVTGASRPQRQLRGPLRRLASVVDGAAVGGDGVDQLPSPGRGIDVAAQQVDLGAGFVHQPVIAVWRPGGQRVDQRRGLGRAPAASSASAALAARKVTPHEAPRPACRAGSRPPSATSAASWNLASLSSASLSFTASHNRVLAIVRSPGQGPPPVQEREPLLGLPAPERVQGEAGQDAGNQGRRTGRLGDLQRPVQRGQDVLPPSLGGPQETWA